jgi:ribosomal subunit interface protein
MKFEVAFRHVEHSAKLEKYAESKLGRLEKYELKPSEVKVLFSAKQHMCQAEVSIKGPALYFRATALGEDHAAAMDAALDKLERQLARHKSKVQFHKSRRDSHEGTLSRMNPQMEHSFGLAPRGRKGSRAA